LRDRVSDRERFFVDFAYDREVTGNLEKAYQTLELWSQTYPRGGGGTATPQDLLVGISTQGTGRFASRAWRAGRAIVEHDPRRPSAGPRTLSACGCRVALACTEMRAHFTTRVAAPACVENRPR
jgi:hypothetical protein